MLLSELLTVDRIAVPLEADDLQGALERLLALLSGSGALKRTSREKLARELASGVRGEIIRVDPNVVVVATRVEELSEVAIALGVSRSPFRVTGEGLEEPRMARIVILVLTPRRISSLKEQIIPSLTRALREEGRTDSLLDAASPGEVAGLADLMETRLHERLLVEDALTPLTYRVYPDTPLREVVDLMVRRGLHAVPVVGESLEVLGIISAGDALRTLLPRKRSGDDVEGGRMGPSSQTARDVMTRTVMCVSEDQSLLEAGNLMINRDVEQLPVVREGELIGFLTRRAILARLFGAVPVEAGGE